MHALPAAPCGSVQRINQTLMTNMTKTFGGRLGDNKDAVFWELVLIAFSEHRFCEERWKYVNLPDSSRISSSVMKGVTSPTRQRVQMHTTIALVVMPEADLALLESPFDSLLLIMCLK